VSGLHGDDCVMVGIRIACLDSQSTTTGLVVRPNESGDEIHRGSEL